MAEETLLDVLNTMDANQMTAIYMIVGLLKEQNDEDTSSEELAHYGVLGMHWGVRRTPEELQRNINKNQDRQKVLAAKAAKYKYKTKKNDQRIFRAESYLKKYTGRISQEEIDDVNESIRSWTDKNYKLNAKASKYKAKIAKLDLKNYRLQQLLDENVSTASQTNQQIIESGKQAVESAIKDK